MDILDYGNGDRVEYEYDDMGRVTKQTYEDGQTVSYRYDNSGALATVTDSETGIQTTYYYDFTDRMMKYVETGTNYSHCVGYEYDLLNNLTSIVDTINGVKRTTSYRYDEDNRIQSVTTGESSTNYTYDGLGRIEEEQTKDGENTVLTDSYTFHNPTAATTSAQVATHSVAASGLNKTYSYTYDDNGNILSVSDGTNTTSYVYDSQNQLLRENNQAANKTWTWDYDNAGNILEKKEYAYTTGALGTATDTVVYSYGDSDWKDLLTSYDGSGITYDEVGNPLTYGNNTYTWQHGRQLATLSDGTTTWSYTYNADGLRTEKTNGTATYTYVYSGSQLAQMTVGTDTLYFSYDASGIPMTVTHNGTVYYYVTNLQGDVIAILDASGAVVVEYTYDAWGNILTATGTMAATLGTVNPLRYRGYVYDSETGLYYISSRYYDPEIGRFMCSDDISILGINGDFTSLNLYIYCGNNPIIRKDIDGFYWETVLDVVFIAIDVYNLVTKQGWKNWKNWVALGADVILTAVPFATGGGQVIKVGDIINDFSKVTVVGETMSRVRNFAKSVNAVDNLYDGLKSYGKLSSKGIVGKVVAEIGGKLQNAAWLYGKLRTGYTVVDIGIDSSRLTRSSSYIMETTIMTIWKTRDIIKGVIKFWQKEK